MYRTNTLQRFTNILTFMVLVIILLVSTQNVYEAQAVQDIELGWVPNSEGGLAGYKVYFGAASGNYDGQDSNGQDSPIDLPLNHPDLSCDAIQCTYTINLTPGICYTQKKVVCKK